MNNELTKEKEWDSIEATHDQFYVRLLEAVERVSGKFQTSEDMTAVLEPRLDRVSTGGRLPKSDDPVLYEIPMTVYQMHKDGGSQTRVTFSVTSSGVQFEVTTLNASYIKVVAQCWNPALSNIFGDLTTRMNTVIENKIWPASGDVTTIDVKSWG